MDIFSLIELPIKANSQLATLEGISARIPSVELLIPMCLMQRFRYLRYRC